MSRLIARIRLAQRGLARADTWVAAACIFLAGFNAANEDWPWVAVLGVVGLIFLVASGDYVWRKGAVAGKREALEHKQGK